MALTIRNATLRAAKELFGKLARDSKSPACRTLDGGVLRVLSEIGARCGIDDASTLKQPWTLDLIYVLLESIANAQPDKPLRVTWPLIATVSAGAYCPSNCTICYSDATRDGRHRQEISLTTVRRLAETPIPIFLLTGGEPLLHSQIRSLAEVILKRKKKLIVATNLFREDLRFIPGTAPNQITILMSIWGDSASHDLIRGPGSFTHTIKHLKRYLESSTQCSINLVVSDERGTCLDGIETVLRECPNIHRIFISRAIRTGRHENPLLSQLPLSDQIRRKCRAVESRINRRIIPTIPEISQDHGRSRADRILRWLGVVLPSGCGAGQWVMHISPGGLCHPCFAFERASPGDISLETLPVHQAWSRVSEHILGIPSTLPCKAELSAGFTSLLTLP